MSSSRTLSNGIRAGGFAFSALLVLVTLVGSPHAGASSTRRTASRLHPQGAGRSVPAAAFRRGISRSDKRDDIDPPEQTIGERLFLETRFAQYFLAHSDGNVNHSLAEGDPVVAQILLSAGGRMGDPFAGQSMNCRNCHFVDDVESQTTNTYGDYSRRSLVPLRGDGQTRTPRNSPPLVNANISRDAPFFLHFDGEFATLEGLVEGTFSGRNFGWLPQEKAVAVSHVARVIREDDGSGDLAKQYGGSYRTIFAGVDPAIPADFRLPEAYRIDVGAATDTEIFDAVTALVAAYVRSLEFARDDAGHYSGSAYDQFLAANGLPQAPDDGESSLDYSRRLRDRLDGLGNPVWITPDDGALSELDQPFQFGPDELQGLKIFLKEPSTRPGVRIVRTGNCVTCHPAPDFTDFRFHNDGASQDEYDERHGDGSFGRLYVPNLAVRSAHPDDWLPATPLHPSARGVYRSAPSSTPGRADLGLWNVWANSDFPASQSHIAESLGLPDSDPDRVLAASIARFKTPSLRDLGQSPPYLHAGRYREIEEVLDFYRESSDKARAGRLRNGAPELSNVVIGEGDVDPLAAFLRSLAEDYN